MGYTTPEITWMPLLPVLLVAGAAVVGVLVEAFVRDHERRRLAQVVLAVLAVSLSLVAAVVQWATLDGAGQAVMEGRFIADRFAIMWIAMLAVFGLLALALFASRTAGEDAFAPLAAAAPGSEQERLAARAGFAQTEVFPLALFALSGMMLFAMTSDVVVMFVVLEVFSLPLYILTALARRRRLLSLEASFKYFLMGAFASAVLIFGAAMLYGAGNTTRLGNIAFAIDTTPRNSELFVLGAVLVLVGLLFKLGAVPFHAWTPDAYQGAPTPVVAFMAAATKAAAAVALARFLYLGVYQLRWELAPALWTVAVATVLLGTVVAVVQTDVKRMLAYSSIAHAGFLVVALASFEESALTAIPFYMLVYGLATIGAFAVVSQVRERTADGALGAEATRLGQWAGLGRRSPLLAGAMGLFLLSFAGIPLTAGFIGKFAAFEAAVEGGAWPLVVVAVLASAVAAFFYVRLIVLMFLTPVPDDLEDAVAVTSARGPVVAVGVTAALTVLLGVVPGPVLAALADAALLVP